MSKEIHAAVHREEQLDLLSYIVMLALLMAAGMFLYSITTGVTTVGVMANRYVHITTSGLTLMLIIYLFDQHGRQRNRILHINADLEAAKDDLQAAHDRLQFSYRAAELMSSLTEEQGLHHVLDESLGYFRADAAAVIGDDIDLVTRDDTTGSDAERILMRVALDAVRTGKQLARNDEDTGSVIAFPLRVQGSLRSVYCLWRTNGEFSNGQLEGLRLVGRIIEMTLENQQLLGDTKTRLDGTISALQGLVELRQPGYTGKAGRITERSVNIGILMGMNNQELSDLRIAAALHDVGMLKVPSSILNAQRKLTPAELAVIRRHAAAGASIASDAHLGAAVQSAILTHHERLDGLGYPDRLSGDRIPLMARIIGAVDVYESMIAARPYREALTPDQALRQLKQAAGIRYDAQVISSLEATLGKTTSTDPSCADDLDLMLAQMT